VSNFGRLVVAALIVLLVPTFAMASPVGKPVKGAHYVGTVGPGYPVKFTVSSKGKNVLKLVVAFDATCEGSPSLTAPRFHYKTLPIKSGRFRGTASKNFGDSSGDVVRISGHFHGRKASGTVTSILTIKSLGSCTEKDPFTTNVKAS
jgi:hypothetical protein